MSIRGYKVELHLNNHQRTACLKHAGAARYTFNWGLKRYQQEREAGRTTPTAISLHKELNTLKQGELSWMYEVSKCAPQEALRNLEAGMKAFFRRCKEKKQGTYTGKCGYPRFKSKKRGIGSFRLTGAIHVFADAVQLPRLGRLRLKEHGSIPTQGVKILSATVSERAGRWFVSVQVEEQQPDPRRATGPIIGIDLGLKTLATLSTGETIANPKALRTNLKRLKRISRRHSRKRNGSKNKAKASRKLARLHARIANIRNDALHKATSLIVAKTKPDHQRPACVVLEDLHITGMLKNRCLSRAIADVGWYEFRRQITYKAKQAGSQVHVVSRWEPSSKRCSRCGWINDALTLDDRVFICQMCHLVHDRDENAAINLAALAETHILP